MRGRGQGGCQPGRVAVTDVVRPSNAVAAALAASRPVVALETSVLAQGLPRPRNLEVAMAMSLTVRRSGAEPGWIWIEDGAIAIGGDERDLRTLCESDGVAKVARRDLPMALARKGLGATTVSATLWSARRAGIEVMATGGIGGVHLGSADVSADLLEMARVPGTVVCSGPKSIVDPAATLEKLEELGIGVLGYGCDLLPFFVVRETQLPLEHRADSPQEVAAAVRVRQALGVESGLLVCNPIPGDQALDPTDVAAAVESCLRRARDRRVVGKAVTPFLLSCMAESTGGRSLEANVALLVDNARLAGEVSAAMAG